MKAITISVASMLFITQQSSALSTAKINNGNHEVMATIVMCSGPDCRVDGSTGSLKQVQKRVAELNDKMDDSQSQKFIKVISSPCLGPCGDGPCCVVKDASGKRVQAPQPQESLVGPNSLVPADLFGANTYGVYQVRTMENVDFVMDLAAQTAGIEPIKASSSTESINSASPVIATATRPWYDRPRNERKVLQRLAQAAVVIGLYNHNQQFGEIGAEQWQVAGVFFVAFLGITFGKSR